MASPYLGEIRMFAGNFPPRGYAFCNGQLAPIAQNQALFALFGTIYGGDGYTTYGLPDLRGRLPVHFGQGTGQSLRPLGTKFGYERVPLATQQMPSHTHSFQVSGAKADSDTASGQYLGSQKDVDKPVYYLHNGAPNKNMRDDMVQDTGGSKPHSNFQPYTCINFIVAMAGEFPPRN